MKDQEAYERDIANLNVMANAVELANNVIKKVAGNEIANNLGEEGTSGLRGAIAARLMTALSRKGVRQ